MAPCRAAFCRGVFSAEFAEGLAIGDNTYIADYLVEEVLQRQPERAKRFLLQTPSSFDVAKRDVRLAGVVVDVDDSIEAPQQRWVVVVDRARAARLGVAPASISAALATANAGEDSAYLHDPQAHIPVPIRLELSTSDKSDPATLRNLKVRADSGALVAVAGAPQP